MTTTIADYQDPALAIEARVADLMARMTRVEKLAQLNRSAPLRASTLTPSPRWLRRSDVGC